MLDSKIVLYSKYFPKYPRGLSISYSTNRLWTARRARRVRLASGYVTFLVPILSSPSVKLKRFVPISRAINVAQGARGDQGEKGANGTLTDDERTSIRERFKGARGKPGQCPKCPYQLNCPCNVCPDTRSLYSY